MENITTMSDVELLSYLEGLERASRQGTINGDLILHKLEVIERQLSYRAKVDDRIKEKLDSIQSML